MKQQDIDDLKHLIEFLKQYQVAEFDLDRGDLKIRLKFAQESAPTASLGELARLIQSAPQASQAAPAQAAAAQPAAASQAEDNLHVVKSPIVGTFYSSPSPGAPSFVSAGDVVEQGQVICIVEAMKLMNEIESDAAGEVVSCLVSNGQAIEFGQPLFTIRPK
ncbi:MAG: acetyl-CoA carboxylase biotin carboxyl carrier protein [Terracidiphilus sp.]|jgi:acetyl-CoA carboxylase biotin carboxyl carrier protein